VREGEGAQTQGELGQSQRPGQLLRDALRRRPRAESRETDAGMQHRTAGQTDALEVGPRQQGRGEEGPQEQGASGDRKEHLERAKPRR